MSFNNISFILHKPQLSENIGSSARAIKNFNFKKLTIIDPKPIFPNDKILATSVGARNIINISKVYQKLEPAIRNIDYLIATTSRFRNVNLKHIRLNNLNKIDYSKKIGFLFGSEASGLSNYDLSLSNFIIEIPTSEKLSSLNLSHAVIVVCYEIYRSLHFSKFKKEKILSKLASKNSIKNLIKFLEKKLDNKRFFKPLEKKKSMILNINNIFGRLELSDKEIRILFSIFSSLNKKDRL